MERCNPKYVHIEKLEGSGDSTQREVSAENGDSSPTKLSLPSPTEKFVDEKVNESDTENGDEIPFDSVARVPTSAQSIIETGIVGMSPLSDCIQAHI